MDLNSSNSLVSQRLSNTGFDDLAAKVSASGNTQWYLTDAQGSARQIVDNSANVVGTQTFDAFGVRTSTTGTVDRYAYTSREWDSFTGLQYNRARMYDPSVGRWYSPDPMGFNAGDANLYRYVGNNATGVTDPSGLEPPQGHNPEDERMTKWLYDFDKNWHRSASFYIEQFELAKKMYNGQADQMHQVRLHMESIRTQAKIGLALESAERQSKPANLVERYYDWVIEPGIDGAYDGMMFLVRKSGPGYLYHWKTNLQELEDFYTKPAMRRQMLDDAWRMTSFHQIPSSGDKIYNIIVGTEDQQVIDEIKSDQRKMAATGYMSTATGAVPMPAKPITVRPSSPPASMPTLKPYLSPAAQSTFEYVSPPAQLHFELRAPPATANPSLLPRSAAPQLNYSLISPPARVQFIEWPTTLYLFPDGVPVRARA